MVIGEKGHVVRASLLVCLAPRELDVDPNCRIGSKSSDRFRKRGSVKVGTSLRGAPGILGAVFTRPTTMRVHEAGFSASGVPRAGHSRGLAGV